MNCHRGILQDKQETFDAEEVTNVSISIMDQVNGPFNLEVASIGLKFQPSPLLEDVEPSAYETYRMPSSLYLGSHF